MDPDEVADAIVKTIDLNAPLSKVWSAISDHEKFGDWFKVKIEAPFQEGHDAAGLITHLGYEHVRWTVRIKEISPETLFSFTWHPFAVDASVDYSNETPTLVEFRLEPTASGTRLTLTESGFGNVPQHRRAEAWRRNDGGWTQQMLNIENFVTQPTL